MDHNVMTDPLKTALERILAMAKPCRASAYTMAGIADIAQTALAFIPAPLPGSTAELVEDLRAVALELQDADVDQQPIIAVIQRGIDALERQATGYSEPEIEEDENDLIVRAFTLDGKSCTSFTIHTDHVLQARTFMDGRAGSSKRFERQATPQPTAELMAKKIARQWIEGMEDCTDDALWSIASPHLKERSLKAADALSRTLGVGGGSLPPAELPQTWQAIETAPKDGSLFLGCNLDHPSFGSWPMYRRVRHEFRDYGEIVTVDLGGWIILRDVEPIYEAARTSGPEPAYSIAPDDLNRSVRYGWSRLPVASGNDWETGAAGGQVTASKSIPPKQPEGGK